MSAARFSLPPFQLRPNKFVDRMLFLDLVAQIAGIRGAQNYAYLSMGAKFLHDHHSVYRRVGIDNLISFDRDGDDIKRQKFNRPTSRMTCLELDSADLPDQIDELRGDKNVAVWLDFTSPGHRRVQLQQSEEILKRLIPDDVFRITLNADYKSFGKYDDNEKKKYASVQNMAAKKLAGQIGEYLPANLNSLSKPEFPAVLANAVSQAASNALKYRDEIKFVPMLSTTYADGSPMVTVACVVRPNDEAALPECLRDWKYRSKSWNDVLTINVPDLSIREKHFLDRKIGEPPSRIVRGLPFLPDDPDSAEEMKETIKNYKKFHRFYPAFHHIEV